MGVLSIFVNETDLGFDKNTGIILPYTTPTRSRPMSQQVTDTERQEFVSFWTAQRRAIGATLSEETMYWFNAYTRRDNVGYETGQLRPGKLGQWDLYFWLTDGEIDCIENEALIASGLTAAEVAEENRREYYRRNYVDPDDPLDVARFNLMMSMTPDELDAEIKRLRELLAESS